MAAVSIAMPSCLKTLLVRCADTNSISQVHAIIILNGVLTHTSHLGGSLIASYASAGDILSARHVFDEIPNRNVHSWNAMLTAYSHRDCHNQVLRLYRKMVVTEGAKPDSSTFTVTIKACTALSDLKSGEEVRWRAEENGYGSDLFVASSLLNMYTKFGLTDEAKKIFQKMPRRDIVSWTTMVTGFAKSGRPTEALEIFRKMQKEGVEGDGVVLLGLIQSCSALGDSKLGLSVHGFLIRRKVQTNVVVQTALIDMYAKHGLLGPACRVFINTPNKTAVSWGALITGFAQNGFSGKALELLVEMQSRGFRPDPASLVSALSGCSQDGFLKLGKSIHGYVLRRFKFDQILSTALIDFYSKCGTLESARALFDRITSRDNVSWNAMISGYGIHGYGNEALSVFLKMLKSNQKPDGATFASLLSALSHSGRVEEGQYWFDLMKRKYNIRPGEKHYGCMVDLLSRAGRVEEAWEMIRSMEEEPGLGVWVALLSGCYNHGKWLVGEVAAENILRLNPDGSSGIYSLVSNFFASGKKWVEMCRVRKMMKESGEKKVPGYSVVDVDGTQKAFVMEDANHGGIKQMLNLLDMEMKVVRKKTTSEDLLDQFDS